MNVWYNLYINMENQLDVSTKQSISQHTRSNLVKWIVDIGILFNLKLNTIYVAIDCMDKYLLLHTVRTSRLKLLCAACLSLACKYMELQPLMLQNFVIVLNNPDFSNLHYIIPTHSTKSHVSTHEISNKSHIVSHEISNKPHISHTSHTSIHEISNKPHIVSHEISNKQHTSIQEKSSEKLSIIDNEGYSKSNIIEYEIKVLQGLEYNLYTLTKYDLVHMLSSYVEFNTKDKVLANYVCVMSSIYMKYR